MTDRKNAYGYDDLILSGKGELFGKGYAQLAAPKAARMARPWCAPNSMWDPACGSSSATSSAIR